MCALSVFVRALGDKSELPLILADPLPSFSATDCTNAEDGDSQDCAVESELSGLVISSIGTSEVIGAGTATSHDTDDAHCDNVTSTPTVNHSESPVELNTDATAAATDSNNYESGADVAGEVASDSKGELITQLYLHISPLHVFIFC